MLGAGEVWLCHCCIIEMHLFGSIVVPLPVVRMILAFGIRFMQVVNKIEERIE